MYKFDSFKYVFFDIDGVLSAPVFLNNGKQVSGFGNKIG